MKNCRDINTSGHHVALFTQRLFISGGLKAVRKTNYVNLLEVL